MLEEVGRTAAPVPALAVMGLAAPALVEFGATDALEGVADGTRIVTAALTEAVGDATMPATSATGGKLTGEKVCVPAGLLAERIVVSANDGIYLVDPSSSGVTVEREDTMLGTPMARLVLRDAEATKLAGPEGLTWLLQRAQTAMAVTMSGVAATALDLTSTYVKERKQFGRAIGTFQAVSQRAADTYINKEAIKLTSWQAAWRLDPAMPAVDAGRDREVLGRAGWAGRAPRRAPPARWRRRRPRLPAPPLLPVGEADGARPRFGDAHADATGRGHRRHRSGLTVTLTVVAERDAWRIAARVLLGSLRSCSWSCSGRARGCGSSTTRVRAPRSGSSIRSRPSRSSCSPSGCCSSRSHVDWHSAPPGSSPPWACS